MYTTPSTVSEEGLVLDAIAAYEFLLEQCDKSSVEIVIYGQVCYPLVGAGSYHNTLALTCISADFPYWFFA